MAIDKIDYSESPRTSSALAGMLMLAAVAGSGCEPPELSIPTHHKEWTSSCQEPNGKGPLDPWGSEAIRHFAYREGQQYSGKDTPKDPEDDEAVSLKILHERECLIANGLYMAGQQRCAGDGTAAAINGIVLRGRNNLQVVVDVQRDEFGNQLGVYPGGGCRPELGFDQGEFELPLTALPSWRSDSIDATLSFMTEAIPADNIPTQEIPSLINDGSHAWASDHDAERPFYDDWGNELTHAPWSGAELDLINQYGDQTTYVADWCIQAEGFDEFKNINGCIVPPELEEQDAE